MPFTGTFDLDAADHSLIRSRHLLVQNGATGTVTAKPTGTVTAKPTPGRFLAGPASSFNAGALSPGSALDLVHCETRRRRMHTRPLLFHSRERLASLGVPVPSRVRLEGAERRASGRAAQTWLRVHCLEVTPPPTARCCRGTPHITGSQPPPTLRCVGRPSRAPSCKPGLAGTTRWRGAGTSCRLGGH